MVKIVRSCKYTFYL